MSEKARKSNSGLKQTKRSMKHYTAVVLFAAIILVFVFWGINPNRMGESSGGFAAVVNDAPISIAEYRSRVENIEKNAGLRLDQFPEAQRTAFRRQIHQKAMEDLIGAEVEYQAAMGRGVSASDGEVRDYILHIPFLSENGRFMKDRYQMWLQQMNLSSTDFERQIRKQLVQEKLMNLFVGSTYPTPEELKLNRELSHNKINIRFVEISQNDLAKPAFVTDEDVNAYVKSNQADIEKYYKENAVEFTKAEKVKASHILIRIDDKRKDDEALKIATDLRKQATPQNFAKLATKNSDDPGSKAKGGELGEFEKGRMVPEFEKAAFSLKAGEISQPIKTNYGYHIIYVEKKIAGGTETLEQAQSDIARKLLVRSKQSEILAKTKSMLEKGSKKDVENLVAKAGLKWNESGEFDLAAASIPKLGEGKAVLNAVLHRGEGTGLVPDLIDLKDGRHAIVDVTSWKQTSDVGDAGNIERMAAYRKSSDLIEAWLQEAAAKANIQRNPAMIQ